MRYVSLFSGVEAATLAWAPLGWEAVAFAEVEPFPCAVLAERFPSVPNLGDVTEVDWRRFVDDRGRPDVVVGGSPCQSFSLAGDRTGLDGASGLMWEYVRAVSEVRPRWLVWENVPGALSSSRGEDFGCLLRALDELGYGLAWRVLDASFFGVPQMRRRVFLVGRLGDGGAERACEVLLEPHCLRRDAPSSRQKREALAAGAGGGPEEAVGPGGVMGPIRQRGAARPHDSAKTATAAFRYHAAPGAGGIGYTPGGAPTVTTGKPQAVLCASGTQANSGVSRDASPALTAHAAKDAPVLVRVRGGREGGGKGALAQVDVSGTLACGNDQVLSDGYTVRRLTPTECERLQGFPDGWTAVEYRGKPAADTPRYKAIGNSMAVPVMRWIGERMAATETLYG